MCLDFTYEAVCQADMPTNSASRDAAKQRTREALISAAVELFAAQGLDTPSLDAICERAGFTRGAFYVHFKDRDDLLVAVMDHVGESVIDALIKGGDQADDLESAFSIFVAAFESGAYPLSRPGGVRPHQLMDACARSPIVRERYVALAVESIRRVVQSVQQGQRDGKIRQDIHATDVGPLILATIIGAQTMRELNVPFHASMLSSTLLKMLRVTLPEENSTTKALRDAARSVDASPRGEGSNNE